MSASVSPPTPAPAMSTFMGLLLPPRSLRLFRRRQEIDFVFGRQRDDFSRRLLGHVVDRPKEIIKTARRRHPEHAFHRALRFVVDRVRPAHRHTYEVARISERVSTVDHQLELALE